MLDSHQILSMLSSKIQFYSYNGVFVHGEGELEPPVSNMASGHTG